MLPDVTVTNTGLEKKNFNDLTTYGGRAALKVDLNDNWTATPTFMYQHMKANGVFFFDPNLGNGAYKIDRFRDDVRKDKFWQAALTVQGKIANFDVTYAGAYMDRTTFTLSDYADYADAYDQLYAAYGGLAYFYYQDSRGQFHQPAAVHHRHRPFQEDEPGTALRLPVGQAVPGDRRPVLPAPDEPDSPGL